MAQPPLKGDWQGGIRHNSEWHPARIHLVLEGSRLSGTAEVVPLGIRHAAVEGTVELENVRWQIKDRALAGVVFEGGWDRLAFRSVPDGFWAPPAFQFFRVAQLPGSAADDYTGWYEWQAGKNVLVTRGSEGGLRFFHLGRLSGRLLRAAGDTFYLAHMDQVPTLTLSRARFTRDTRGAVARFEMNSEHKERIVMHKLPQPAARLEYMEFQNGSVALKGMLLAPADGQRHPAVIFIHGTGYNSADRSYEMSFVETFLARGIAVLLFDKRGCGGSSGDWRTASLEDLAGDVVAAVNALRDRKEIARDQIGVYGISEGGWVAPIVAARSPDLAFLINQGGPAVSPLEDELDDLTAGVKRFGFPPEDLEAAMNLARAWVELYRSPAGLVPYQAALQAVRQKPWFPRIAARMPESEDDWEVQWWRKRGRFEPASVWKTVRVPALVLVGEKDDTMNVPKNLTLFEQFRASSAHLEIRLVPGADHGLRVDRGMAPGFPEAVAEWILRTVRSPRS